VGLGKVAILISLPSEAHRELNGRYREERAQEGDISRSMLSSDLKESFTLDNLQRAWLWTRTNPNREYKQYFRHIYRAYAIAVPQSLRHLRHRLNNETYQPSFATKIYFPKKSGILRPYSLLCIEDQLVYQALINTIATQLARQVSRRYLKSVFGNVYAGKRSRYFYHDWRKGYRAFSFAIRNAVARGFVYSASFDLTACYDSIDHKVLSHFLARLGLEKEFGDFLCRCLSHWTVAQNEQPIYIGHGIPQGPLPSGLLSEIVLRHFDEDKRNPSQFAYFRYVDDIRLFSRSEEALRKELIRLDKSSKEIGLFPQSAKIDIHRVKNVEEEIKSISNPPEWEARGYAVDQAAVRRRLFTLTARYKVANETRFKYVLGRAAPNAALVSRLLEVVRRQPHLYRAIFGYISRAPRLTRKSSSLCLKLLESLDLYTSLSATIVRSIRQNINSRYRYLLYRFCKSRINGKFFTNDPELRVAVVGVMLDAGKLTWAQTRFNVTWKRNWWVRTGLIADINPVVIGTPSYQYLIDILLQDKCADVSVVAAETLLTQSLHPQGNTGSLNIIAQHALRNAGEIGKTAERLCIVSNFTTQTLGTAVSGIQWKKIAGTEYRNLLAKVVRWAAYAQTDATAWVNVTDTINDLLLERLFGHDTSLGIYTLGNFGAALTPSGGFARKYPKFHAAISGIHKRRVGSDLSHAKARKTGRATKPVRFRELQRMKALLTTGYLELWRKW
jgi:hypothetical protein